MLRINKKVEYALMVLKFMATEKRPGELTTAREICDRFHIPFDTASKAMQAMAQEGILRSFQGIRGGYQLARELSMITCGELVKIVEKERPKHFCDTGQGPCKLFSTCNIITPLNVLNLKLNTYITRLNLENLLLGDTR